MPVDKTYVDPRYHEYLDEKSIHRDDAAEILEFVGKNGPGGRYPIEIPPYLLGKAVRRLVYNYDVDDTPTEAITREFLAGFFGLKLE